MLGVPPIFIYTTLKIIYKLEARRWDKTQLSHFQTSSILCCSGTYPPACLPQSDKELPTLIQTWDYFQTSHQGGSEENHLLKLPT